MGKEQEAKIKSQQEEIEQLKEQIHMQVVEKETMELELEEQRARAEKERQAAADANIALHNQRTVMDDRRDTQDTGAASTINEMEILIERLMDVKMKAMEKRQQNGRNDNETCSEATIDSDESECSYIGLLARTYHEDDFDHKTTMSLTRHINMVLSKYANYDGKEARHGKLVNDVREVFRSANMPEIVSKKRAPFARLTREQPKIAEAQSQVMRSTLQAFISKGPAYTRYEEAKRKPSNKHNGRGLWVAFTNTFTFTLDKDATIEAITDQIDDLHWEGGTNIDHFFNLLHNVCAKLEGKEDSTGRDMTMSEHQICIKLIDKFTKDKENAYTDKQRREFRDYLNTYKKNVTLNGKHLQSADLIDHIRPKLWNDRENRGHNNQHYGHGGKGGNGRNRAQGGKQCDYCGFTSHLYRDCNLRKRDEQNGTEENRGKAYRNHKGGKGKGKGNGNGKGKGKGKGKGWNRQQQQTNGCYICGDMNHWARECPNGGKQSKGKGKGKGKGEWEYGGRNSVHYNDQWQQQPTYEQPDQQQNQLPPYPPAKFVPPNPHYSPGNSADKGKGWSASSQRIDPGFTGGTVEQPLYFEGYNNVRQGMRVNDKNEVEQIQAQLIKRAQSDPRFQAQQPARQQNHTRVFIGWSRMLARIWDDYRLPPPPSWTYYLDSPDAKGLECLVEALSKNPTRTRHRTAGLVEFADKEGMRKYHVRISIGLLRAIKKTMEQMHVKYAMDMTNNMNVVLGRQQQSNAIHSSAVTTEPLRVRVQMQAQAQLQMQARSQSQARAQAREQEQEYEQAQEQECSAIKETQTRSEGDSREDMHAQYERRLEELKAQRAKIKSCITITDEDVQLLPEKTAERRRMTKRVKSTGTGYHTRRPKLCCIGDTCKHASSSIEIPYHAMEDSDDDEENAYYSEQENHENNLNINNVMKENVEQLCKTLTINTNSPILTSA